jgi:hypothetical protein
MKPHPADATADAGARLKVLLLATPLLGQFRQHPDCLRVEVLEGRWFDLTLDSFPGLDKDRVGRPRDFSELVLPGVSLTGGHFTSGGPDGVVVRRGFEFLGHDPDNGQETAARTSSPRLPGTHCQPAAATARRTTRHRAPGFAARCETLARNAIQAALAGLGGRQPRRPACFRLADGDSNDVSAMVSRICGQMKSVNLT